MAVAPDELPDGEWSDELLEVRRRRYQEAREAGLSIVEAKLFADGDQDVGTLRRLVALHCEPDLIALIVI
jgi:hypothetical protein